MLTSSGGKRKEVKKETGLGLSFKKEENFGEWYSEVFLRLQNYMHQLLVILCVG